MLNWIKNNTQTLALIGGTISVGVGVYLTYKGTCKYLELKKKTETEINAINEAFEASKSGKVEFPDGSTYNEETYRQDLKIVRTQYVINTIKTFAPAGIATVGGLSFLLFGGIGAIKSAKSAMALAATESSAFLAYRNNVKENFGNEVDYALRNGAPVKVETVKHVDENGNETIETKTVCDHDIPEKRFKNPDTAQDFKKTVSPYATFFSEYNTKQWVPNIEENLHFLKQHQSLFTDRLQSRGYLLLNEVLEDLGLPLTEHGYKVGWLRDGDGDGYVDFGIDYRNVIDTQDASNHEILINPNIDGLIVDKLNKMGLLALR